MVLLEAAALGFVFGVSAYGGHLGRLERGTFRGSVLYGQVAALGATAIVVVLLFVGQFVRAVLSGSVGGFVDYLLVFVGLNGVVAILVTAGIVAILGSICGIVGNVFGRR